MFTSPRLLLTSPLLAILLLACSSSSTTSGSTAAGGSAGTTGSTTGAGGSGGSGGSAPVTEPEVVEDLQGRAYDLDVPKGLDESKPVPLLLALHGFVTVAGNPTPWTDQDNYMKWSEETRKRGMILALPHGTIDKMLGSWSWNGTDACCGWDTNANDIGYLMAVISEIESKHNIDKKRIFLFGHSNGGFMVNRMACDRSSRIAGIVSLAGETFLNEKDCIAADPVAMLQVQGDADMTVFYEGGAPMGLPGIPKAPGAVETAATWAKKNGCDEAPAAAAAIDLVTNLDGAETEKSVYKNCDANGQTELWTIKGGPHSPKFNETWAPSVIDFLMAHPKP